MLRVLFSALLLALCGQGLSTAGHAQQLPIKTDLPQTASGQCETDRVVGLLEQEPSSGDQEEARRLLAEANQAAILGEDRRATELLRDAAELDPASPEVAYRLGRLLQAVGEVDAALVEFCRYLVLDPEGSDVPDVQQRVEALGGPDEDEIPAIARIPFQQGVSAMRDERYEDAALHFSRALVELPNWPDAHYNRGIAYLGEGRDGAARADLERYLELEPDASDAGAVRSRLRQMSPAVGVGYNPRTVLATGLVFPGLGHFYSGRPATGMLFLGAAGASAAVAVLHTEVMVSCRVPPDEDGQCPPDAVADRTEDRPLLVPGLAVAGAITLAGAIHAFVGTRQGGSLGPLAMGSGGSVAVPALSGRGWESAFEVEPRGPWGTEGIETGLRIRF